MSTVRVNTSDTAWISRHAPESEVIPYGQDARGIMFFQIEFQVDHVEHVTFAKVDMIRFSFGSDAPSDHSSHGMYPTAKYLVAES